MLRDMNVSPVVVIASIMRDSQRSFRNIDSS
jgi:hypothetical protein